MYIFCEETVKRWMDEFKSEGRDIDEEIKDIKADIENNKLWKKGSLTKEGASCHEQNIADLTEYLARLEELAKREKSNNCFYKEMYDNYQKMDKDMKNIHRKPRNKKGNISSSSNPFNQSMFDSDHFNKYMNDFDEYMMRERRKGLLENNQNGYAYMYMPIMLNNLYEISVKETHGTVIDNAGRIYLEVITDIGQYYLLPLIINQNISLTEFVSDVDEEFLPHLYKLNWDHNGYLFKCKEKLNEKILGLVFKEMHIDIKTKIFGKEDIILEKIFYCLMKYKRIIELPLRVESVNIESKVDEYGSSTEFSFNKEYEKSYLYKLDQAHEYK